jgi:hypothetical protein
MTRKTPTPQAGQGAPKTIRLGPKRPSGRPSGYSQELADRICLLISEGKSLRAICERDDMPSRRAVFTWLMRHDDFASRYARARELQADLLFDEILEIADDTSKDFVETTIGEGITVRRADHEHINRSRLRVDTRKWMAAKLAPKKYGERVTQEISGLDGAPLAPTIILTGRPEPAPAPEAVAGVRDKRH